MFGVQKAAIQFRTSRCKDLSVVPFPKPLLRSHGSGVPSESCGLCIHHAIMRVGFFPVQCESLPSPLRTLVQLLHVPFFFLVYPKSNGIYIQDYGHGICRVLSEPS